MKHRTYSIFALLLALLTASSCSNTSEGSSNETTDTENITNESTVISTKDRIAELGERDFGGETFVILDDMGNINVNHPDETLEGDMVNDKVAERNKIISEKYNINFEYLSGSSASERAQLLRKSVMSDEKAYDLFFSVIPTSIGPLATEGILADLAAINELSLDEQWWSKLIYENCRIDGKMYYTTGDISPISYRAPACYYANETLLEEYKISKDDIYSAVENGTWTLDMLNQLAGELDRDLNNDGTLYADDDFFGILNEDNGLTAASFMVASGVNLSSINDNGELYIDLNSEKAINVVEKLSKVLSKAPRKDNNALHDAFKNDRVVFLMHYASSGYTRYRDMNSNYIMLPLPKYDESQENYRSLVNTWMNAFVCIPANADTERAGFIMEVMAYMSRDMLRPVAYDMAMKVKGVRNEKDSVMLDTIIDSIYLDFNSFMEFGGCMNQIAKAIFKDGAYISAITSITDTMNAEIDKFSKAWIGAEN
ncbi:MAG: hypothetical protein HFE63_09260 [Clostridiales bacterium]|nr:hypothetical protein [Clostridiales bacterium]